jgi:mono/diheme cytochrome c family protein
MIGKLTLLKVTLSIVVIMALGVVRANAADSAADLFANHCARCHGSNGKGNGMLIRMLALVRGANRPADFSDAAAMRAWTDDQLAAAIAKGGAAIGGSTLMPAYGGEFSPKQISELVAYIRSLSAK